MKAETRNTMQDHIVITCALTGAGPMSDNPNHPVTPRQIADSGLAAAEAGAAILHVHVRDPQTREFSGDCALYEEAVGLIREQNPDVILNLTTGLGSGFYPKDVLLPDTAGPGTHIWSVDQRIAHVLKLRPDVCTLDLVTAQVFGGIVISTEAVLTQMAERVRELERTRVMSIGRASSPRSWRALRRSTATSTTPSRRSSATSSATSSRSSG